MLAASTMRWWHGAAPQQRHPVTEELMGNADMALLDLPVSHHDHQSLPLNRTESANATSRNCDFFNGIDPHDGRRLATTVPTCPYG
jgi:hypothetical protein